ncbi:MAG: protein TolR [Thioalkalivibrionaceae bacterium]
MADVMSRGRRRRSMSQINVVPFIDVMLVLLIIFMITAPMLMQGVEVDLPQADAQAVSDVEGGAEPIVLTVQSNGALTLNRGPFVNEPLAVPQLVEIVSELLAAEPTAPTYVRGDRAVDYGRVMQAMTALQRAGAVRVGLITSPGSDDDRSVDHDG